MLANLRYTMAPGFRGLLLAALSCELFLSGSLLVSKQIVEQRAKTSEDLADLLQLATLLEGYDSGKRAQTTLRATMVREQGRRPLLLASTFNKSRVPDLGLVISRFLPVLSPPLS